MSRYPSQVKKDTWRRPQEVLEWMGIQHGHAVGEISGGNGYWSHFFGKAVGDKGEVFVHNATEWKELFDEFKIMDELEPCGDHVKFHWSSVETPFDDVDEKLDLVFTYTNYHDLYDMPVDRKKMLANIRKSLKPGSGVLVVIDHQAETGSGCKHSGSTAEKSLHRVEKSLVIKEILEAGFVLEEDSDFLCYKQDDLSLSAWKSPQTETDRFALKFRISSPKRSSPDQGDDKEETKKAKMTEEDS